MRLDGTKYNT
jgi:uncharacterized membrane protein